MVQVASLLNAQQVKVLPQLKNKMDFWTDLREKTCGLNVTWVYRWRKTGIVRVDWIDEKKKLDGLVFAESQGG